MLSGRTARRSCAKEPRTHRSLGKRPVDDIALRVAPAHLPKVEASRQQVINRLSRHPLTMFNYVKLGKSGVRKVFEGVNANLPEHKLAKERLDPIFEKWWPDFENHLQKVKSATDEQKRNAFDMEAAVEEMLHLLRSISKRTNMNLDAGNYFSWPSMAHRNPLLEGDTHSDANLATWLLRDAVQNERARPLLYSELLKRFQRDSHTQEPKVSPEGGEAKLAPEPDKDS